LWPASKRKDTFPTWNIRMQKWCLLRWFKHHKPDIDALEEQRPKVICIDELDKMSRQFKNQLLNVLDSGHIKVDYQRKFYDFEEWNILKL